MRKYMKTYRARDLIKGQVIIKDNEQLVIDRVEMTNRGNILVWINNRINEVMTFNPMDVVLLK